MNVDLSGRVALVTGSSRGIGKGIAEAFARAGARVWFHGLSEEPGRERYVTADFTSPGDVQRLAETIARHEPRLDILVNNAGIEPVMPLDALDLRKFADCFAVNVSAAVHLTTALLPLLKRSGVASVINITSIHDSVPYPHNAA